MKELDVGGQLLVKVPVARASLCGQGVFKIRNSRTSLKLTLKIHVV